MQKLFVLTISPAKQLTFMGITNTGDGLFRLVCEIKSPSHYTYIYIYTFNYQACVCVMSPCASEIHTRMDGLGEAKNLCTGIP